MMSIALNNILPRLGKGAFTALALLWLPHIAHANTALLKEVPLATSQSALGNQPFVLTLGAKKWTAPPAQVRQWYKIKTANGQTVLQLRPDAIFTYLNTSVSPKVNDVGEFSRFELINGKLSLVKPGRKGKIVDGTKTSLAIRAALAGGTGGATLHMKEYRPAIFSADDFKKLSFPDKLAQGESSFAGSPKNRIHNIQVATKRYHGLVIMPGEEFSFNQHLGEVDAANGYLPELVIKENVTTPEYGGGVCQVSTTAFRAALQAGLQVTARRNHSYPVAYYGTPGYDATVYSPTTDFRFKNDRSHPIYLKTNIVGTKVIFEVWGTNDGRQVKINGPFVTERRPDGSLTAAVAQIVTKNGKSLREQNFVSRYQSPDKFPTIRKANGE